MEFSQMIKYLQKRKITAIMMDINNCVTRNETDRTPPSFFSKSTETRKINVLKKKKNNLPVHSN